MRRTIIFAVTIVFAIAILARAGTYTVRFTEAAVLTTFGSAGENSVQTTPGLKFKWPDPIQSVTKYDTRARYLQPPQIQQQTADQRPLVVEVFCTWRVTDPLLFFQRFSNAGVREASHYSAAESLLSSSLRSAMGEISRYRLEDLFTPTTRESKLPELEQRVLASLLSARDQGKSLAEFGVTITEVGISRIILPEGATSHVMDSMREDRRRLVREFESRGAAQRQAIISTAEQNAAKIEQFASAYAAEIRRQGDLEAEQFIAQMNESPDLAVFLKNIEFIRTATSKRITWIVSSAVPGFELMSPGSLRNARQGQIPGISGLMQHDPSHHLAEPDGVTRIAEQRRDLPAPAPTNAGDRQ